MDPATRAARSDGADPASGGLTQPIWPATSYARDADGAYLAGRSYARDQNPTGEAAEALLAALETGADPGGKALLFSSGMAAAAALVDALAPGALVVAPSTGYATIRQLLVE